MADPKLSPEMEDAIIQAHIALTTAWATCEEAPGDMDQILRSLALRVAEQARREEREAIARDFDGVAAADAGGEIEPKVWRAFASAIRSRGKD